MSTRMAHACTQVLTSHAHSPPQCRPLAAAAHRLEQSVWAASSAAAQSLLQGNPHQEVTTSSSRFLGRGPSLRPCRTHCPCDCGWCLPQADAPPSDTGPLAHTRAIDECFRFDSVEQIQAALEARGDQWGRDTLKAMQA